MELNRIYNMDCMEGMKRLPDKFFELAIVDPPYFKNVGKLGYFGAKSSSIGVKRGQYKMPNWNNQIPDENYLNELIRVSRHQIIWGINYYKFFHCPGRIIWDKCNYGSPFSNCEIASCSLHDSVRVFRFLWDGMRQGKSLSEPTVMQGNKKLNEKRIHATQKPVALYRWLLSKYANPGDKILDTHVGSASSLIACMDMGFDFVGFEIDPDYYAAASKRMEQFKGQTRLFT